jgi:hypothetical protein
VENLDDYQSQAISMLLLQTFMLTVIHTTKEPKAPSTYAYDPTTNSATTTIPGFGKIIATYDNVKKHTTFSFPAYEQGAIPAFQMQNFLEGLKDTLRTAEQNSYVIEHEGKKYKPLLFAHRQNAELGMEIFAPIVHAQGHVEESDMFTVYDGIQTHRGKFPAVLIEENALKNVITKELGGRQKGG